jgi:pimeloyl-ACP methyl ester carboxylesterase
VISSAAVRPVLETVESSEGPVEIARAGEGPPVLFVHGTPGGSDTSTAMGQFLVDAGFELVTPSRPGYRGTPLGDCATIDQQADLLAALMTALGHDRFAVVAWSGGGPSSYRLAIRHPERVTALVPFACVSGPIEVPNETLGSRLVMDTSVGHWLMHLMAHHAPASAVKLVLGEEGHLSKAELKAQTAAVVADPRQAAVPLALVEMTADYDHRRAGVENDLRQIGAIESLELERMTVPTLIVNGDADTDVDPSQSDYAAATVPGARRIVMEKGTHVSLFAHPDAGKVQAQVIEFLRSAQVVCD